MQTRTMRTAFAWLAAATVGACSTARPPVLDAATVVFVRHAEKQQGSDPDLTEAGQLRAERLAAWLGAARVTHVYSTDTRRTRATAAPLAEACGLRITGYRDQQELTSRFERSPPSGVTLVVGHSNTIPACVRALGGSLDGLDPAGNMPDDDYDRVVVVTLCGARGEGPMRAVATLDLRMPIDVVAVGR